MNLVEQLARYSPEDWTAALETVAPQIHPIDLNAARIWMAFFPLQLHLALEQAADPAAAQRKLGLMGKWRLADHIDSSHTFLYGHRYWPQAKRAVIAMAKEPSVPALLPSLFEATADHASRTAQADRDQLLGITIAALMTLRQVGLAAFEASAGTVQLPQPIAARSIRQLQSRRSASSAGVFSWMGGRNKRYRMTFDENTPDASFTVIAGQDIASGAQSDKRDYRSKDERCIPNEGPIPVECRAASCGTCWVGVIAGADRLSPVDPSDEGKRLKVFGYASPKGADGAPLIRLACQAKPSGDVTFVIPPWNGIIGRL